MQLRGEVEFPEVASPVRGATLYIRLLDVSRADASDRIVAGTVLEDVSVAAAGHRIAFALEVGVLDTRSIYSLEAHLDLDGSGEVTSGDYRTMEHFDVSPATISLQRLIVCRPIG